MLRCGVLIVDNKNWILHFKYHLLLRSAKIQFWHGVPLKKIGLSNEFEVAARHFWLIRFYHFVSGHYCRYRILLSPSEYFSRLSFERSFRFRKIIHGNYPRNEIFFRPLQQLDLIGAEEEFFEWILEQKKNGWKLLLYLPTFRDSGGNAFQEGVLDPERLNAFCEHNRFVLVIKFHSWERAKVEQRSFSCLFFLQKETDIYPYLKIGDLLITDYSSVYFDFTLQKEKAVVFFPYDLSRYLQQDRKMYFAYEQFALGLQAKNQEELEFAILNALNNEADRIFFEQRQKEISLKR